MISLARLRHLRDDGAADRIGTDFDQRVISDNWPTNWTNRCIEQNYLTDDTIKQSSLTEERPFQSGGKDGAPGQQSAADHVERVDSRAPVSAWRTASPFRCARHRAGKRSFRWPRNASSNVASANKGILADGLDCLPRSPRTNLMTTEGRTISSRNASARFLPWTADAASSLQDFASSFNISRRDDCRNHLDARPPDS